MTKIDFGDFIIDKGRELYRDMPWRRDTRPYYVLVSELMLQQTQVERVIPKFEQFISCFPDETALSRASLAEVLQLWQGLGYNRRAKYLLEAVRAVVSGGEDFPQDRQGLLKLPGVGPNTAGALLVYAYNQPEIFIETNIRTVYFHHFFNPLDQVDDADIRQLLHETLDRQHPREFYWALMDYGSWLKRNGVRNVGQSKHYQKQSPLQGSLRQTRGQIVATLRNGNKSPKQLEQSIPFDERFEPAVQGLLSDGLIEFDGQTFRLAEN